MRTTNKILICVTLALATVSLLPNAGSAQMASATRYLSGGFVPGGGYSTSATHHLTGTIGSGPTGISTSATRKMYGGVLGVSEMLESEPIGVVQRPTAMPEASYRIIGVPVTISDEATPAAVFLDDLGAADQSKWRLGRYSTTQDTVQEYPNITGNVAPGLGYWLIARGGRTYDANGTNVRPWRYIDGGWYYPVALSSGWNQVANPFPFAIDWRDVLFQRGSGPIQDHSAAFLEDSAYYYDGTAYATRNQIPAWEGFFMHVDSANVTALFKYEAFHLIIVTVKESVAAESASEVIPAWKLEFALEANGRLDAGNFAGVIADASTNADQYDFSEPPRAPDGPMLAFRLPGDDERLRRSDFRPTIAEGATWDIKWSLATDRTLSISGCEGLPKSLKAVLVLDVGTVYRIDADKTIELPNDSRSGRLVVGNESFASSAASAVVPKDYELSQNFPNPFNPETSIRFGVPAPGHVDLVVINALGQRVRQVVNSDYGAGWYTAVWDGRNESGEQVASGVYFYRLTAGDYSSSRKMLLLK
jgi:hypothetical protein